MKLRKTILLTFALFLTACAGVPARVASVVTPTATAQDVPQGTPEMVQVVELSTPAPTSDTFSTQIALIHVIETKQAEINTLREQSKQGDVDIANAHAAQAASQADSDKHKALDDDAIARQKQADVDLVTADAARIQAESEAKQIELAAKQAETETQRAQMAQTIAFSFVAVLAIGTIAVLRLASLRIQEAAARAPRGTGGTVPVTNYVTETPAGTHIERVPAPPGGITEQWLHWAYLARVGQSVAYNKMTGADQPYKNSVDYAPVYQWAFRNKIIGRNVKGATVVTKRGEQYLDDELIRAEYHAPAPSMDESQIMPPTDHAQDNPAHDTGGEVVL